MRGLLALALVLGLSAVACTPKEEAAPQSSDASTANARDSAGTDSVRARPDTMPVVTTTSKVVAAPRKDSIMGRDSAFGPMFKLDANGKAVPIKKP